MLNLSSVSLFHLCFFSFFDDALVKSKLKGCFIFKKGRKKNTLFDFFDSQLVNFSCNNLLKGPKLNRVKRADVTLDSGGLQFADAGQCYGNRRGEIEKITVFAVETQC